jgi:hypothetical protein
VLHAAADGVGPALLLSAPKDAAQYLINVPEGFARLALEHKLRPSARLSCVLLTSLLPQSAVRFPHARASLVLSCALGFQGFRSCMIRTTTPGLNKLHMFSPVSRCLRCCMAGRIRWSTAQAGTGWALTSGRFRVLGF